MRIALAGALAGLPLVAAACIHFRSMAKVGPIVERDFTVAVGDAADADVHVDFYCGRMLMRAADEDSSDTLVALHARDNLEEVEPRCEERRDGRHVSARLWLDTEHNVSAGDDDERTNSWTIALGRRLPIDLDVALAVCDGDCDLGAVALKRARVSLGAGEATLRFSRPNPVRLEELRVELGAGDFAIRQLGNARCRSIAVETGVGKFEIDCHGEWTEPALLRVETGMGSVEIRIPRDLPTRVDVGDFTFGNLAAPDFRDDGHGRLSTSNWTEEGPRLSIEIEARFGNVKLLRE
jgi:hypothetical protein